MTIEGETSQHGLDEPVVLERFCAEAVWTLLSPDAAALPSSASLEACADRHFATVVRVLERVTVGTSSRLRVDVAGAIVEARSFVVADAADAIHAANRAVAAIGGAGFEHLVPRTKRVWFLASGASDERASITLVAVLAAVLLAPVVPPEGDTIFGIRGARERLGRST